MSDGRVRWVLSPQASTSGAKATRIIYFSPIGMTARSHRPGAQRCRRHKMGSRQNILLPELSVNRQPT